MATPVGIVLKYTTSSMPTLKVLFSNEETSAMYAKQAAKIARSAPVRALGNVAA